QRKGHRLALEALSMLPDNATLLIAGGRHPDDKSDFVERIQADINIAGLSERVKVTGYLPPDSVAQVMSATDLVLAPFTETSGSGSLAMAFACGKPILASDIGPHKECLAETPGCLSLFRSGDASALAAT